MPRFSRISWNRRDEAEPPRIESSREAAKRRRSERERPGAPMQTWYCSVSFFAKRKLGGGAFTSGRRRVQLAAECVEDLRDLLRRVVLGALEQQVLEEVRDTGLRVGLIA